MGMRFFFLSLLFIAQGAFAEGPTSASCPAPLEFLDRKEQLLSELQETKNRATGLFLTRHLAEIHATAPNRRAQGLLNLGMDRRRLSDLEGAATVFDRLIDYCPGFAEGFHQRAMVRRAAGDF